MSGGIEAEVTFRPERSRDATFNALISRLFVLNDELWRCEVLVEALYQMWVLGDTWAHDALEEYVDQMEHTGQGEGGRT